MYQLDQHFQIDPCAEIDDTLATRPPSRLPTKNGPARNPYAGSTRVTLPNPTISRQQLSLRLLRRFVEDPV